MKKNKQSDVIKKEITYTILVEQVEYRHLEKLCKSFAFIMLVAFPFVIGTKLYENLTEVKFYSFVVITSIFIIACIITACSIFFKKDVRECRERHITQKITLPQVFIFVYMLWGILSAVLSDFDGLFIGQGRYEGVLSMLLYGFIFILLSFWGEFTNRYIYGVSAATILIGFFAFTQIMGSGFMYPNGYSYGATHFLSTIGNIDCVSGYIALMLPILCISFILLESKLRFLSLAGIVFLTYVQMAIDVDSGKLGLAVAIIVTVPFILNSKRRIVRTLIMLGTVFGTIGIQRLFIATYDEITISYTYIATHSKVGIFAIILGVICGICAALVHRFMGELKISPKRISIILGGIIIALVLSALIWIFTYSGSNTLLVELSDALHGNLSDDAGSGRGAVWKRTLIMIGAHPIIGSGTGSFLTAFAPLNVGLDVQFDFAHNDFLQIAACQGIVGLVLYLGFIISLAVRAYKNVFKCPWVIVFIGAAAGYLTHSFFSFSIAIIAPMFWVIAGLLDKMIRQIPSEAEGIAWPREELELMNITVNRADGKKPLNNKRKKNTKNR